MLCSRAFNPWEPEGHFPLFAPVTCYILGQQAEKQQLHESSLRQQNAIRDFAICQSKHVTKGGGVCLSINTSRIRFEQICLLPSVVRIHKFSFRFLLVTFIGKSDECILAFSSGVSSSRLKT